MFKRLSRARARAKKIDPCFRLRLRARFRQTFTNQAIVANLIGGERWEAAIPKARASLLPPDPALEPRAIACAFVEEPFGFRQSNPIAPNCGLAPLGLGEEVF